ncbi:MAG: DinB family protein [Bacteroidia bacterium]|jgi:uncharacterized damage-inducible protein DinB
MKISKPEPGTYPAYYEPYISIVKGEDLMQELLTEHYDTIDLITSIDLETQHYRYAEGKWNVKEVVQHIMDAERVFAYRALCIARGEQQSLPGYDDMAYVLASGASERNINDMAREFSVLRASTIELFKSFSATMLEQTGMANKMQISVKALLFITLGHEMHHRKIIEDRYLPK